MAHQQSIESAEDLFRKLERTFDRRQAYGEYQVDWVFDLAITAWHLVDWVARERSAGVSRMWQPRQELSKRSALS